MEVNGFKKCYDLKIINFFYIQIFSVAFRQGQDTSTVYHFLDWKTVAKIEIVLALIESV